MPGRYVRLAIKGDLPQGEVWSVNPAFIGNFESTAPSHAELATWAGNARDYFFSVGLPLPLRELLSAGAQVTSVRAQWFGEDGKVADYADAVLSSPAPGSGDVTKSLTTALCLSLYSEIPGRQYRGRLYWPALGADVDPSTGRVPSGDVTAIATGAVAMLAALEAACPATWDAVLAVYSPTRGAGVSVSSIRVGNVLDSQRGRRDALVEAYAQLDYPS